MEKDKVSIKNLIIFLAILAGITGIVIFYQYYEKITLHHPLIGDQIDSIVFESYTSEGNIRKFLNEKEMEQFVKRYNSAKDIKNNKELVGIGTPKGYIKINLRNGEHISICDGSLNGLEVQTMRDGKSVCYWMKQPKIKKDLLEINDN
jgi:hypothetical protein